MVNASDSSPSNEPVSSEKNKFFSDSVLVTATAIFLALGLTMLVGTAVSVTVNRNFSGDHDVGRFEITMYALAFSILFAVCWLGAIVSRRARLLWDALSPEQKYDRYLAGLGYALVVLAILNFAALAGFARIGRLQQIFSVDFQAPGDRDNNTASSEKTTPS